MWENQDYYLYEDSIMFLGRCYHYTIQDQAYLVGVKVLPEELYPVSSGKATKDAKVLQEWVALQTTFYLEQFKEPA